MSNTKKPEAIGVSAEYDAAHGGAASVVLTEWSSGSAFARIVVPVEVVKAAPALLAAAKESLEAFAAARFIIEAAVREKVVTFAACDNPITNLDHFESQLRAAISIAEAR